MACGLGCGIVQIPHPAVHAGIGWQRTEGAQPIERNKLLVQVLFRNRWFIDAGEFANEFAAGVENFERDGS